MEYFFGKGLELLSASLVLAVCQDAKVFRIRKFSFVNYSSIVEANRVLRQALAAILEPVSHIFLVARPCEV